MVYDEMVLLQRMKHPNIVRFHDWFESKVIESNSYTAALVLMFDVYIGQILHSHPTGDGGRAFRPDLRIRQVHRERCFPNDKASS